MSGAFFILIVLILFLVWLGIARPNRRRQASQQSMIDNIEIGDEVLTAGGFFATVLEVADDEVTVELSPGAQARLSKRAIAAVFSPEAEEAAVGEPTEQTPS